MIDQLRKKLIYKWNNTPVKNKLIGGAVIIVIALIIILN
jgi:hypothetical protein